MRAFISIGLSVLVMMNPLKVFCQTNIDGCRLFFQQIEKEELRKSSSKTEQRYQGVCRLKCASGFDLECKKAEMIFKKLEIQNTKNMFDTVLLVQRYPDGFFSQSNFKISEEAFSAKVCTPLTDLKIILANVLFNAPPEGENLTKFFAAYDNHVKFIFFENVFTGEGPSLEIGDLREFFIVDTNGNIIKFSKKNSSSGAFNISFDRELKGIPEENKKKECVKTHLGDIPSAIDKLVEIVSCGILPE